MTTSGEKKMVEKHSNSVAIAPMELQNDWLHSSHTNVYCTSKSLLGPFVVGETHLHSNLPP